MTVELEYASNYYAHIVIGRDSARFRSNSSTSDVKQRTSFDELGRNV